jgi:hypothetical protein
MDLTPVMIVATLVVHVLYGVVLGLVYGFLLEGVPESASEHHRKAHTLAR